MKPRHNNTAPHGRLELDCPFCSSVIELAESELFDGGPVSCPHCGEEATMIRERIEHSRRYQWSLILPEREEEERH